MTEEILNNNQGTSEGAVRHLGIPYARLEDTTPTPFYPSAVLSRISGVQLCGTVLSVHDKYDYAIIDFTHSAVYFHYVRNVRTYAEEAEATWGTINIGDPVWYDRSATMPANCKLSTSPLDNLGAANPLFGFRVPIHVTNDTAVYGTADEGSTNRMHISQVVSGGYYS